MREKLTQAGHTLSRLTQRIAHAATRRKVPPVGSSTVSTPTPSPAAFDASASKSVLGNTANNAVPSLYYKSTSLNEAILSHCELLKHPYAPVPWMPTGHAQTVLGQVFRPRVAVNYHREMLELADGGHLAVDWDTGQRPEEAKKATNARPQATKVVVKGARLPGESEVERAGRLDAEIKAELKREHQQLAFEHRNTVYDDIDQYKNDDASSVYSKDSPILIMFPGLTGGSSTKYIRQTVTMAREAGVRSAVFNYRGFRLPLTTPMASTGVDVGDVYEVIKYVHETFPHAPIMLSGYSMGANMMVKYLGQAHPEGSMNVIGAMAVSNAFDFLKLSNSLSQPVNQWLYSRPLAWAIKQQVLYDASNVEVFGEKCDISQVKKARTIREIDDKLTRELYGIPCVDEYYKIHSSRPYVKDIATPLLCLNSLDDPFLGEIPFQACQDNDYTILAVTERGGHVCWASGLNPLDMTSSWMCNVHVEYMQALLKEAPRILSSHAHVDTAIRDSRLAFIEGSLQEQRKGAAARRAKMPQ